MESGIRVGAISHADKDTVYFYGYGTYEGNIVPPVGVTESCGIDLGEIGIPNPKIQLDNGNIVWGCQCWWGSEKLVKEKIGGRKIEIVNVAQEV